jgi:hypothetical protein
MTLLTLLSSLGSPPTRVLPVCVVGRDRPVPDGGDRYCRCCFVVVVFRCPSPASRAITSSSLLSEPTLALWLWPFVPLLLRKRDRADEVLITFYQQTGFILLA